MSIICIFFPAIIICGIESRISGEKNVIHYVTKYACSCIGLNLAVTIIALYLFRIEDIWSSLNHNSRIAVLYLLLSTIIAVIEPYIEKYIKENVSISIDAKLSLPVINERMQRIIIIGYTLLLFALHFIRIFDNSFWGDEGISINASRMPWGEMLEYIAQNGHSPLYYVLLWVSCKVFGSYGIIYNLVSLIPYFIVLIVALTIVRKRFGIIPALLLITLESLLRSAIMYNVEVRMYSWCQLFVFLTYLTSWQIFRGGKARQYIGLTVFSLGAIYCHYFALSSIGILYAFIFFYFMLTNWKSIWKIVLSGCIVLTGFLPWIVYCYEVQGEVMMNYGIEMVGWKECFDYIFYSNISWVLLAVFIIVFCAAVLYDLGVIKYLRTETGQKKLSFVFDLKKWTVSPETIWILSGVSAVFGTIIASEVISYFVYPILVLRYLYASVSIVWLILGICVSKCRLKKLIAPVLVICIVIACFPRYFGTLKSELVENRKLKSTLEATSEVDEDDFITTDIDHLSWTVSLVYYPNTPRRLFGGEELPEFSFDVNNWLYLGEPISDGLLENLKRQNCHAELVVENGYIGTGDVWVYKVIEDQK